MAQLSDAEKAQAMTLAFEKLAREYKNEGRNFASNHIESALNILPDSSMTRLYEIITKAKGGN